MKALWRTLEHDASDKEGSLQHHPNIYVSLQHGASENMSNSSLQYYEGSKMNNWSMLPLKTYSTMKVEYTSMVLDNTSLEGSLQHHKGSKVNYFSMTI